MTGGIKIKYSVFICDDDQEQVDFLNECITRSAEILSDEDKVEFDVVKNAKSYKEATEFINSANIRAGIYFLDIELGEKLYEKNGIDIGACIKEKDDRAQLIFITSHKNMAFLTFERRLGAVDFIVKSDNLDKMHRRVEYAIEKAINTISKYDYIQKNTFKYRFGNEIRNISLNDVIYITTTAVAHKLRIIKTTGWADFIGNIKDVSAKYDQLIQISQSCIVNPENIKEIKLAEKKIIFINNDYEYFSVRNTKKVLALANDI